MLGTWMNEEGDYRTAVEKMDKKTPLMALTTRQVGNMNTVGRYALAARLKLVDLVCIRGLLYGAEAVPSLEEEMEDLEKIQHKLLCEVVGLPQSTPYMPLLMELGMWMMKYRIQYKKLMLYHNLIHSNKERIARRMVMYQLEEGRKGTWAFGVEKSIKEAKIEIKAEDVLKSKWKKEVKSKLLKLNETEVRERCQLMRKGRTVYDNTWGRQAYVKMEIGEAREIMKMRLHMMPLPCNYGGSDDGCPLCKVSEKVETEHYLQCEGVKYLREKWGLDREVRLGTEDEGQMRNISKYLRQICTLLGTGKGEGGYTKK